MGRNRLKIAIFSALFFGFVAAYGIYNFLIQQREAAKSLKLSTTNVIVASRDIGPGTTVSNEMVKVVSWPRDSVPAGSFSTPKQTIGKVVMIQTVAGEPLIEAKLAGSAGGLTVRLSPGFRAMAVKVDEIVGVSGFIAPNDHVDVISTMEPPGKSGRNQQISKIVLQNKRVLSVAQNVEREKGKPNVARSITLEVTPAEGEKLSLASLQGKIILALRAAGDQSLVHTRGSTARDLLALAAPAPPRRRVIVRKRAEPKPVPEQKKKYQVEIYLGNQKSVQEF